MRTFLAITAALFLFPSASLAEQVQGHEVTITHGSKINPSLLQSAVRIIKASGCPTKTIQKGSSRQLTVETNGKSATFTNPLDAVDWATAQCHAAAEPDDEDDE